MSFYKADLKVYKLEVEFCAKIYSDQGKTENWWDTVRRWCVCAC